jgi:hypothetical protein
MGIQGDPRIAGASRVTLGPTSAKAQYLGMRWFVIPVYSCCISTYLTFEKNAAGEWQFRQDACESGARG